MMGDKMKLMFWDFPTGGWVMEVHPDGVVALRYFNKESKIAGRLEFDKDCDMDFIREVLTKLGFTPDGK